MVDAGALTSLGLFSRQLTRSAVGRSLELTAAGREVDAATRGLACLAVEGEPGIGKTHLVLAIEQLAMQSGFVTAAVTADEEIRGPFLLARGVFGSMSQSELMAGSKAMEAVTRAADALASNDEAGLRGLAPDNRQVRLFDLAAVAVRSVAAEHPVAILLDDVQWADEDSLKLLRYVIRTNPRSRVLFVLAARGDELAQVNEAVTLLADVERMGLLRRMKLSRFTQSESADFLQQVLGGPMDLPSAAIMHSQAEGVPFILAEQAQAYRDAGLVQRIDGVWRLARNADRLLPSAVRTLIQRRAAHLPPETRTLLAEAGVLGRSVSLRDLKDMKARAGDQAVEAQELSETLAPAVAAGLLTQFQGGQQADFRFTHEGVRDYAVGTLPPPRRRALHEAVIQLLTSSGQARPESLPLIAQHALAAGRPDLGASASIEAARNALQANAPEEAMRLVAQAQPVASQPRDRVALLLIQDDALEMLRRPSVRLEHLAQLSALAGALGDTRLEMDVMLRRAAAFRISNECDSAADMARRVVAMAAEQSLPEVQLAGYLELGQALLRCEIGDGYVPTASEVDIDAAAESYAKALELAEQLNDEPKIAAASRELGVIAVARFREWFVERVKAGDHIPILQRMAAGEKLADMLSETGVEHLFHEADSRYRRALEIYERIGDRQGAMSTIIAMAYMSWGPDIHMPGSAKRIEEIRRLAIQMNSFTRESERAVADAQMLYGVHVYSRAKGFFDAAIVKGIQAFEAARALGERTIEFAAASGVTMAHADLGDVEQANAWLERAAGVAALAPTPARARTLELVRGRVSAVAGDAKGMQEHLERSIQLAAEQGRPAARAEALACLALDAARLGAGEKSDQLLALATRSAGEAIALLPTLSGNPAWGAQAHAALARAATAAGDTEKATAEARAAFSVLQSILTEDLFLDVRLPAARALLAGGTEEERNAITAGLRLKMTFLVQQIEDDEVRVRWLRSATGQEMAALAGPLIERTALEPDSQPGQQFSEEEGRLMRLLVDARTNREIAAELGVPEDQIARRLVELYAKVGASSRAEATSNALIGKLV